MATNEKQCINCLDFDNKRPDKGFGTCLNPDSKFHNDIVSHINRCELFKKNESDDQFPFSVDGGVNRK